MYALLVIETYIVHNNGRCVIIDEYNVKLLKYEFITIYLKIIQIVCGVNTQTWSVRCKK